MFSKAIANLAIKGSTVPSFFGNDLNQSTYIDITFTMQINSYINFDSFPFVSITAKWLKLLDSQVVLQKPQGILGIYTIFVATKQVNLTEKSLFFEDHILMIVYQMFQSLDIYPVNLC